MTALLLVFLGPRMHSYSDVEIKYLTKMISTRVRMYPWAPFCCSCVAEWLCTCSLIISIIHLQIFTRFQICLSRNRKWCNEMSDNKSFLPFWTPHILIWTRYLTFHYQDVLVHWIPLQQHVQSASLAARLSLLMFFQELSEMCIYLILVNEFSATNIHQVKMGRLLM